MVRTRRLARPTLVALTLASLAAFTASDLLASASGSPFETGTDVKVKRTFYADKLPRRGVCRLRHRVQQH